MQLEQNLITSCFILGQKKRSCKMFKVFSTPKCPINPLYELHKSWVHTRNFETNTIFLFLNKYPSCLKKPWWDPFSHYSNNLEKSWSWEYKSFMWSNPNIFVSSMEIRAYLLESASTTTLALPWLCLITWGNCSKNSTHLACLLLSFPWLFKCLSDLWSLWTTNSLGRR